MFTYLAMNLRIAISGIGFESTLKASPLCREGVKWADFPREFTM